MRFIFFSFISFFVSILHGQELLPNTNFKNVNICCEYHVSCAPMGWWTCSGGTFNIEKNTFDSKGNLEYKPTLIRIKSDLPEHRSFIQAPILCDLIQGEEYELKIELKARDYLPENLGILFSDSFIIQKSIIIQKVDTLTGLFQTYRIDSALRNTPDTLLSLQKSFWPGNKLKIVYRFIAKGNEKFIVIGNFLNDEETALNRVHLHRKAKETLLEIYNVSLQRTDKTIQCNTVDQLEMLETLNRRHTFYGACSDTIATDMNRLFSHWKEDQINSSTPEVPEIGKHYRMDGVYFEFDKYELLDSSFASLDSLIGIIKAFDIQQIRIEGHTDSLGSIEYNKELSYNRANAVAEYIQKKLPYLKIGILGLGSDFPARSNKTEIGRVYNRRVELIFLADED